MVAYTKPQQRKKGEWIAAEKDQIKLIDLRFERGKVVGKGLILLKSSVLRGKTPAYNFH